MKTIVWVLMWCMAIGVHGLQTRRALSSTAKVKAAVVETLSDYSQCGGRGVLCNTVGNNECKDRTWSATKCSSKSECMRQSGYFWMCQPKNATDTHAVSAPGLAPAPAPSQLPSQPYTDADGVTVLPPWSQCGGTDGDCTKYGNETESCVDCSFPGTRCATGYTCLRVVEFYWQCSTNGLAAGKQSQCEGDVSQGDAPVNEAPVNGALVNEASTEAPSAAPAAEDVLTQGHSAAPAAEDVLTEGQRGCEAPLKNHAIQGKRFKAEVLTSAATNYNECCTLCTEASECVGFHLNTKSSGEQVTCALFSEFTDVVAVYKAVAGVMTGATATNMAG